MTVKATIEGNWLPTAKVVDFGQPPKFTLKGLAGVPEDYEKQVESLSKKLKAMKVSIGSVDMETAPLWDLKQTPPAPPIKAQKLAPIPVAPPDDLYVCGACGALEVVMNNVCCGDFGVRVKKTKMMLSGDGKVLRALACRRIVSPMD